MCVPFWDAHSERLSPYLPFLTKFAVFDEICCFGFLSASLCQRVLPRTGKMLSAGDFLVGYSHIAAPFTGYVLI